MKEHTHRQYLAWMAWLEMQWDRPSRTDWYLMQIAAEVYKKFRKNPAQILVETFKLRFKSSNKAPVKTKAQKEMDAAAAKARWFGMTNFKRKK